MDGEDRKVSLALCTYNGEAYVRQQLESIRNQSRTPDEMIVCDDGSSDRTLEIVDQVASTCAFPVRVIRNSANVGFIKNFEQALGETTGGIIFLSDQDDVWFPEKIATMLPVFSGYPGAILVYCDAELTDAALRPTGDTVFSRRRRMQLTATPTAHQLGRGIGFQGVMMAFRARLKPHVLPFSNQWPHDHWISFIAYAVGEVRWINRPLLYYRRHGKNDGADADLDGGTWHRMRVVARKSQPKQYAHRVRRFSHLLERLQHIKSSGLPVLDPSRFEELLKECEECLRFARQRENLKDHSPLRRVPLGLYSLARGDYHHHAHGLKSFFQDVAIP